MESRTSARAFGPAPELPTEVFAYRRAQLLERIGGGVAVIPAAPELVQSRDTEIPYRPASDLYYLTGLPEPHAIAVLTPHDEGHCFTLFVRPRDPEREAWSGPRIGIEGAAAFGANSVYPIHEVAERLPALLRPADRVHYPVGAVDSIDTQVVEAIVAARRLRQRSGTGPTSMVDLEAATGEMRLVKESAELERLRVAAEVAAAGHVAAMRRARPGAGEWEVQAALEATFRSLAGSAPAFPSIVGGGANATILHYIENRSRLRDGDLVLIDAGAEWGMYCSDITRTFPVSGRFSTAQRDLYDIVWAAEEAGIAAARPGSLVTDIHDAAVRVLARGMIDLGILPKSNFDEVIESEAYKRFYVHQTSHWLGIDVHDAGPYQRDGVAVALQPGMVVTVEPGIYISADAGDVPEPFRGVGIRIEDDVIVRGDGPEVITRGVPVDPTEIEALIDASGGLSPLPE